MVAKDGKMRMTDVADNEQLFRLIQSIPSPKAESSGISYFASGKPISNATLSLYKDCIIDTYFNKNYPTKKNKCNFIDSTNFNLYFC